MVTLRTYIPIRSLDTLQRTDMSNKVVDPIIIFQSAIRFDIQGNSWLVSNYWVGGTTRVWRHNSAKEVCWTFGWCGVTGGRAINRRYYHKVGYEMARGKHTNVINTSTMTDSRARHKYFIFIILLYFSVIHFVLIIRCLDILVYLKILLMH